MRRFAKELERKNEKDRRILEEMTREKSRRREQDEEMRRIIEGTRREKEESRRKTLEMERRYKKVVRGMPMEQTIKETGREIKKIYHMADIHIRVAKSRHVEYRRVLEKLYAKLEREREEAVIVICGDIMHEKCRYSATSLGLVKEMLKRMTSMMEVIVIMGNHDGIMTDNIKEEGLTPAIGDIAGVYYLRESGIYGYENVVFGVSSFYDGRVIMAEEIEGRWRKKIALYHGMVSGSVLQNRTRIQDGERERRSFKGYDYVLLGDIHKHQYLDVKRTICYSGSLIQQNHGESVEDHGVVIWEVESGKSELYRIRNEYGYVTIVIEGGKVVLRPRRIPRRARLRVRYTGTEMTEGKMIIEEIAKREGVKWERVEWDNMIEMNREGKKEVREMKRNIREVECQNEKMREYCGKQGTSEKKMEKMEELNRRMNERIGEKEGERLNGEKWEIINLKFSNMFSYGENNEIDFTKKRGIQGVIAPNHYGKSSIIDIILFSLYDKCTKGTTGRDLLNKRKDKFSSELIIRVKGEEYKIVRKSEKETEKKKTATKLRSLKVDVELYKYENGEEKEMTEENRKATYKKIAELVGEYDDMILTNVSLQEEASILNYSKANKIDYLLKLSGLDVYDELLKEGKDEQKIKKHEYMRIKNEKDTIKIKELEEKKEEERKRREEIEREMKEMEEERRKKEEEIYENYKKLKHVKEIEVIEIEVESVKGEIYEKREKVVEIEKNIKAREKEKRRREEEMKKYEGKDMEKENDEYERMRNEKMDEWNEQIQNLSEETVKMDWKKRNIAKMMTERNKQRKEIEKLKRTQEENKKEIEAMEYKIIEGEDEKQEKMKELELLEEKIKRMTNEVKQKRKKKEELRSIREEFENFEYDEKCDYCVRNPFTRRALISKENYNKVEKDYNDTNEELLELKYEQDKMKNVRTEYEQLLRYIKENDKKLKKVKDIETERTILKKDIEILEIKLEESEKNIKKHEENKNKLERNREIYAKIKKIKVQILLKRRECNKEYNDYKQIKLELDKISKNLLIANRKKAGIEQTIEKLESLIEVYNNNKEIYEDIEHNKNVENKIATLKEAVKRLNNSKKNKHNKLVQSTLLDSQLTAQIKYYYDIFETYKSLADENEILDSYIMLMGKNGIPFNMLNTMITNLENYANTLLQSMNMFSIKIEQSNTINIYKEEDTNKINILCCSGFEKFIVGTVLRLAIIHTSNLPQPNFIIFDEGFSCLDTTNLSNLSILFDFIKDKFDFALVISHIDDLKSNCDKFIEIIKEEDLGDSHVNA